MLTGAWLHSQHTGMIYTGQDSKRREVLPLQNVCGDKSGLLEDHRLFLVLVKSSFYPVIQGHYKGVYPHSQEHWLQGMLPIIREWGKATTGSKRAHPGVWLWQPFLVECLSKKDCELHGQHFNETSFPPEHQELYLKANKPCVNFQIWLLITVLTEDVLYFNKNPSLWVKHEHTSYCSVLEYEIKGSDG